MMYPYLTLNDDTEITHSEMKADGKVKVYIETPDEFGGFHNATCWLPDYRWEDIEGYSDTGSELKYRRRNGCCHDRVHGGNCEPDQIWSNCDGDRANPVFLSICPEIL